MHKHKLCICGSFTVHTRAAFFFTAWCIDCRELVGALLCGTTIAILTYVVVVVVVVVVQVLLRDFGLT